MEIVTTVYYYYYYGFRIVKILILVLAKIRVLILIFVDLFRNIFYYKCIPSSRSSMEIVTTVYYYYYYGFRIVKILVLAKIRVLILIFVDLFRNKFYL